MDTGDEPNALTSSWNERPTDRNVALLVIKKKNSVNRVTGGRSRQQ